MEATNGQVTIPAGGVWFVLSGCWTKLARLLTGWRGLVVWVPQPRRGCSGVEPALGRGRRSAAAVVVLPCAVMMLSCMKGMNRGQQTNTAQTSPQT